MWQILPTGPRAKGNSPYSLHSSFAGNTEYIDIPKLCDLGIIEKREILDCATDAEAIRLACDAIGEHDSGYLRFLDAESYWLEDFALYMAIRKDLGIDRDFWPEDIRRRESAALLEYSEKLKKEIELIKKSQYLFFIEWRAFKEYLEKKNIELMGDLPIYLSSDSAEVWANPEVFLLDEKLAPSMIAGVPPDGFSDVGQLWGNPVYNWEELKNEDYEFWTRRFKKNLSLVDILRIDHFRGFESYWAVPQGAKNAADGGAWYPGPGRELVEKINNSLNGKKIVAEDLGYLTPEVEALLAYSGWPSTRVLQFGFADGPHSEHFPKNVESNSALYTGTHDNDTLMGFLEKVGESERLHFSQMLGCSGDELFESIIRAGMNSKAELFIAPMQDYLKLGSEARMNIPGVAEGNWKWQLQAHDLNDKLLGSINELTKSADR